MQAACPLELDEELIPAVHEYWVGKRAEFGRPLLPRLWFEEPWAKQIGGYAGVAPALPSPAQGDCQVGPVA